MRLRQIMSATALAGLAVLTSGCGKKAVKTAAPAGIAYLCEDGRPMRVVYDGGGARAKAQLLFDGGRYEMSAAPAISGLRYASETGLAEGQALVWSTDGVTGSLGEVPVAQAGLGEERVIARCSRLGWDAESAAASAVPAAEPAHDEEAH